MRADIVTLDAVTLDPKSGAPLVSAKQPVTGDDDVEDFGDAPLMQALGLSAAPYGKTADGYCEGVVMTVGARDAVCVGARDTRTAKIIGNLKPGDTVLHTTGPNQAAQLQLKEAKKQAVLVTKGSDGKQMLFSLDGNGDKVTLAAFGMCFEFNKQNQSIALMVNGTTGIVITAAGTRILGPLLIGPGSTPMLTGSGAPIPGIFV